MLSGGYFEIDSDYSLIPESRELTFENDSGLKKGEYKSIGISPGYAFSLIFSDYYVTSSIFIGTGIMKKKEHSDLSANEKTTTFNKLNFRIAAGYNGDDYMFGVIGSNDTSSSRAWFIGRGTKMSLQIIRIEMFAGVRF